MKEIIFLISIYFFINEVQASTKSNIINNLKNIDNLSFNFEQNINDKFIIPSDLIIKKVNKNNGEISDGQNTIIDYFTKEQLEIYDNIKKIESIGGIN